jgi:GAF domain-containing protein
LKNSQPKGPSSRQTGLRQVLDLGEDLICIAQGAAADESGPVEMLFAQHELVLSTLQRLFDGTPSFWLAEEVLRSSPSAAQGSEQSSTASYSAAEPSRLMQSCIETQKPVSAARSSMPAGSDRDSLEQIFAIAAPLLVKDPAGQNNRLLGVVQAERQDGPSYSPDDLELLEGIAVQAALALQSSLYLSVERWRREQLDLVQRVSLQIANLRDLDELAQRVTNLIQLTFSYYYVAIFTSEPGNERLAFRASSGPSHQTASQSFQAHGPVRFGEGIIGHAAQTGQELLADDVLLEPSYRATDLLPGTRSEIALPLIAGDRLLGVLDVHSDQPGDFDEMDLLVLRALSGSIAIAIDDALLYQDQRRRAVQLQAVYEVSSAITSILDQDELLNEVVRLIQERFGFPYVHLFTVHPGRRKIFYEAGSGLRSQVIQKEIYIYDLDDPLGLIPWVARSGSTALVNDVRLDSRYRSSGLPPVETLSELTVPLIFGGNVLGLLDVQSDRTDAFSEDDRFLFEALADTIAITMRNASLYRTEVWRRGVADSLREVAGILSADVDLDQVLDSVLSELEKTLKLDAAAIWLLDESVSEQDVVILPGLHLAAVHGMDGDDFDLEIGLQPEEVLEYNLDSADPAMLQAASSWLLQALHSDFPIVRIAGTSYEPLGAVLGFLEDYSAIAAPLRIGDRLLGVLSLVHRTPGRYGSEAQAMSAAFASYSAVAIENARLYEDAHEQAWISTVLLQVANATQSVDDLPQLLDTVIRITPMLTGVKACLLYILDEEETFIPVAASGLNSEQQVEFERWRFAPGDVPALDRLLQELHPVILRGDGADERLASILAAGLSDEPDTGFPVLVPLVARGDVLGAFLVEYSAALPTLSLGKPLEAFLDERLAILQGIAHQTAIAMDNIRLLKSQKEDAYVSVALLQVAQAVVSSNDLDEAIGSIVRITPILVGVKRAAIYLWDGIQKTFRVSQSYGLPREAELLTYSRGNFPLLDAVLAEDRLLAAPLEGETAGAEAPVTWTRLRPPAQEMVNYYLEEETCLLIAFPLSVKGKVLGVFLVEEPDFTPSEPYSSSGANRRLRSKRMEIITGISQQAALAIQNDNLQKETVERERLEREMQLAREIQQAFLPQNIPKLTGWDLQAYWRPARQVSGDFYDFFPLPKDRLGLLIADVADKGMPAALFMTLVRTLVRASVQELESPAQVIRRVNDLLVPDSLGGMFVTLAYGVLDLKTGSLKFANAGHNPPLVVHRPCRIERLERTGMALGVEAGALIEESQYQIERGELLVLYTDGVTESFSPQGEMFGEERLSQLIEDLVRCGQPPDASPRISAGEIIKEIDQKVIEFTGETLPHDDLTLVVLKRNPSTAPRSRR